MDRVAVVSGNNNIDTLAGKLVEELVEELAVNEREKQFVLQEIQSVD